MIGENLFGQQLVVMTVGPKPTEVLFSFGTIPPPAHPNCTLFGCWSGLETHSSLSLSLCLSLSSRLVIDPALHFLELAFSLPLSFLCSLSLSYWSKCRAENQSSVDSQPSPMGVSTIANLVLSSLWFPSSVRFLLNLSLSSLSFNEFMYGCWSYSSNKTRFDFEISQNLGEESFPFLKFVFVFLFSLKIEMKKGCFCLFNMKIDVVDANNTN